MCRCRWLTFMSIGSTMWCAVECSAGDMCDSLWNMFRSPIVGQRRRSSRSRMNGAPVIGTKIECLPPKGRFLSGFRAR